MALDLQPAAVAPVSARPRRFRALASTAALSSLFLLTGVGTALLGSALPAFLAHWSLADRDGGRLFLFAWIGSTCGAFLSMGRPATSVARGAAVSTLSCFALIHAGRGIVFPLIFCYGTGLGITMTSISLLCSERQPFRRQQEMNRLNMLWAVGALGCPALATHALRTASVGYLFAILGAGFAALAAWTIAMERDALIVPEISPQKSAPLPSLPWLLGAMSLLIVGVESATGGWLTTYVQRSGHSVSGAVTASTAFWAGLLLCRALYSTRFVAALPELRVLRLHLLLVAVCTALVCVGEAGWALLPIAFFTGFGLGPLYPMLLALVLPRFRGRQVFVLAGLGSAIFPWLTGWTSTHAGSLRSGLLVPCAAAWLLVVLAALDGRAVPQLPASASQ